MVENEHTILIGGQKRDFAWWSKGRKGKKAFRKATMAFRNVVFAFASQKEAQARITPRTKAEERTKKGRPKKALMLNLDFQLPKHPVKKVMAILWNQTTDLPAVRLTIPQPQLLGGLAREPLLHG